MFRFLVAAIMASVLFSVSAAAETKVRFGTFNVYWLYDDKAPYLNWADRRDQASYEEAIRVIGDAIKEIDADVLALQEIEGENVLRDLTEYLRGQGLDYPYFWAGQTLEPVTGQNVGLLSKFPNVIEPVKRYPGLITDYLSSKGQSRVAGIPKLLRVDLDIEGNIVTVFATHLKSQRGGDSADYERHAQAKMLRRLVRVRTEKGNGNNPSFVAVMGDLNDYPNSLTMGILRGNNDGSYNLSQASTKLPEGDAWSYIFQGEKQLLDHVLMNKFLYERVQSTEMKRFPDSVSDHDAMVVEVVFENEGL